ncbi:hypothetical protein EJ04DRAFT_525706 [Polyplosphaeria fusca]|uniref:Uncharacterized protein n=1 Tax=Polyplosphaeria fusca TaxID=682080 RepID=A0A9P4QW41_9PLEO|nr:hypothetical protein EJ04DRAFT_525706 [Polyplosphaeria fusca]
MADGMRCARSAAGNRMLRGRGLTRSFASTVERRGEDQGVGNQGSAGRGRGRRGQCSQRRGRGGVSERAPWRSGPSERTSDGAATTTATATNSPEGTQQPSHLQRVR